MSILRMILAFLRAFFASRANLAAEKPYTGVNPLLLAIHAMQHSTQSRWYGTFNQWKALGGTVIPRGLFRAILERIRRLTPQPVVFR